MLQRLTRTQLTGPMAAARPSAAEAALVLLASGRRVDAVLTDQAMPGLTGPDRA